MTNLVDTLRGPSPTSRPPTAWEERRNGILGAALILLALLAGWGLKSYTQNATNSIALGGQLPEIAYPANWLQGEGEGLLLQAINPKSPSRFDSRIEVFARDLRPGEDLDSISASWPLRRSRELNTYRNLQTEIVTVLDGQPALLITYGYVADTAQQGSTAPSLPVVVKAQDLVFVGDDGANQRLIVITTAADAAAGVADAPTFARLFDRLNLKRAAEGEIAP